MDIGPATAGLVAACMARGLAPEETQAVFEELNGITLPDSAAAMQQQLDEAIARHKKPELTISDLNDYLFRRGGEEARHERD